MPALNEEGAGLLRCEIGAAIRQYQIRLSELRRLRWCASERRAAASAMDPGSAGNAGNAGNAGSTGNDGGAGGLAAGAAERKQAVAGRLRTTQRRLCSPQCACWHCAAQPSEASGEERVLRCGRMGGRNVDRAYLGAAVHAAAALGAPHLVTAQPSEVSGRELVLRYGRMREAT